MKRSVGALFFLHLVVAVLAHLFSAYTWIFRNLMFNYNEIGNGYDIFSIVVVSLIFIVSAILHKQIRPAGIPLFLIIIVLLAYLEMFALNWAQRQEDYFDAFVSVFFMLFSATTGVLIALLVDKSKISVPVSMGVGVTLYVIQEIMLTYLFELHNPQLWIYGLMVLGCVVMIGYLIADLEMMITRRSDYYEVDFWYNGFIDLHMDLFFCFWRDLFRKNPYEDAVDTLKEMGDDKQTPIHITVEEANKGQTMGVNTGNSNVTVL